MEELGQEEIKLAERFGFELIVLQYFKHYATSAIKQLKGFKEEKKQLDDITVEVRAIPYKYQGISTSIKGRKQAREIVDQLKRDLLKKGYLPFYTESASRDAWEIGVIKTDNHYQLFDIKPTSATNYGLSTKDIIIKLKEWEEESAFQISFIDFNSLELVFHKLPEDLSGFARRVKHFCPDIIEQGTGSVEELEEIMKASKRLFLWWD
jgi:hypothetical protein